MSQRAVYGRRVRAWWATWVLAFVASCNAEPPAPTAAPRCVLLGIAAPENIYVRPHPQRDTGCEAVLRELMPGAGSASLFEARALPVGEIECEGLQGRRASLAMHFRMLLSAAGGVDGRTGCFCAQPWSVQLSVAPEGAPRVSLTPQSGTPGPFDHGCQSGPEWDERVDVPIDAEGHARVAIHLDECTRNGPTRCLFVLGTTVTLETTP